MSKMDEIAKILGVEFGSKFFVQKEGEEICCRLNEDGLWKQDVLGWSLQEHILCELLRGNYKIKLLPWKAKMGDRYYLPYLGANTIKAIDTISNDDKIDNRYYERGFMCKTEEQANELAKAIVHLARKMQGFDS